VNGSTPVSKTGGRGSNPLNPAKARQSRQNRGSGFDSPACRQAGRAPALEYLGGIYATLIK
jgi:hypothetical protein